MLDQLLLGSLITFVSLVLGALLWWALTELFLGMERWLRRLPRGIKSLIIILMVVCSAMIMMTCGVWLWAIVFNQIGVFNTLEEAVYYSLVAYTTLGLGDVVVPKEQRLLGGMTAANGFLMFGLMTAMVTDTLRDIRALH